MNRTRRSVLLIAFASLMALLLVLFGANRELARDPNRPDELQALVRWMNDHPADWMAASAITDRALDSTVPRRFELWRAAYAHAQRLAPRRPNATAAFVRGGLFHWYELGPQDRAAVLGAAAPLLRDPGTFASMHRPLWELTHDLGYLRRNAPETEKALTWLRDIAATHGLFDQYRELRRAIEQKRLETFEERRASLTPPELVTLLPPRLARSDEALVVRVLQELHRRPLDAGNAAQARSRADELVAFALRHRLRPLDGLDAMIETSSINAVTRARLAIALGRDRDASNIELSSATGAPEWFPYYRDRAAFEAARGDEAMAARYRERATTERVDESPQWLGTCGKNEVCTSAVARIAVARAGAPIVIHVQNAQSDEVPPYVEIYVGDSRMAEGAVNDTRRFEVHALEAGANRVEVRVANPWTRNRIQRRVRLS